MWCLPESVGRANREWTWKSQAPRDRPQAGAPRGAPTSPSSQGCGGWVLAPQDPQAGLWGTGSVQPAQPWPAPSANLITTHI